MSNEVQALGCATKRSFASAMDSPQNSQLLTSPHHKQIAPAQRPLNTALNVSQSRNDDSLSFDPTFVDRNALVLKKPQPSRTLLTNFAPHSASSQLPTLFPSQHITRLTGSPNNNAASTSQLALKSQPSTSLQNLSPTTTPSPQTHSQPQSFQSTATASLLQQLAQNSQPNKLLLHNFTLQHQLQPQSASFTSGHTETAKSSPNFDVPGTISAIQSYQHLNPSQRSASLTQTRLQPSTNSPPSALASLNPFSAPSSNLSRSALNPPQVMSQLFQPAHQQQQQQQQQLITNQSTQNNHNSQQLVQLPPLSNSSALSTLRPSPNVFNALNLRSTLALSQSNNSTGSAINSDTPTPHQQLSLLQQPQPQAQNHLLALTQPHALSSVHTNNNPSPTQQSQPQPVPTPTHPVTAVAPRPQPQQSSSSPVSSSTITECTVCFVKLKHKDYPQHFHCHELYNAGNSEFTCEPCKMAFNNRAGYNGHKSSRQAYHIHHQSLPPEPVADQSYSSLPVLTQQQPSSRTTQNSCDGQCTHQHHQHNQPSHHLQIQQQPQQSPLPPPTSSQPASIASSQHSAPSSNFSLCANLPLSSQPSHFSPLPPLHQTVTPQQLSFQSQNPAQSVPSHLSSKPQPNAALPPVITWQWIENCVAPHNKSTPPDQTSRLCWLCNSFVKRDFSKHRQLHQLYFFGKTYEEATSTSVVDALQQSTIPLNISKDVILNDGIHRCHLCKTGYSSSTGLSLHVTLSPCHARPDEPTLGNDGQLPTPPAILPPQLMHPGSIIGSIAVPNSGRQ